MTVNVAITGAAGRMGRNLIHACHEAPQVNLTVAIEQPGHAASGRDAGELAGMEKNGVIVTHDLDAAARDFDVGVDFTVPDATVQTVQCCRRNGKRLVIGTTGLIDAQRDAVKDAARDIAIVMAPNMSVAVNLCFSLLETAARVLGDDVDIEIIEAHHRNKIDAPSGTALAMGEVIARTLGRDLKQCAVYGRQGATGARPRQVIGFETIRAGDIVGEHSVMFADVGERLEITHKASNRMTFAKGAIRAAAWVMQQPAGLYDMRDVLGLK